MSEEQAGEIDHFRYLADAGYRRAVNNEWDDHVRRQVEAERLQERAEDSAKYISRER